MKTRVLIAVTLLAGFAASAQAAIVGSKHDLSVNNNAAGTIHSTTQNQTCVFCHAPHNAVANKLLWNRLNMPTGASMTIYTSFNTTAMRTALGAANNTLVNNSSSLLCLSCHSLPTANIVALVTNTQGTNGTVAGAGAWATRTGNMNDLRNDHPVGIDYTAAFGVPGSQLVAAAAGKVGTLRLFASSNGSNQLECASCHNVHDNANGKFLANTNANSALCVICHVK